MDHLYNGERNSSGTIFVDYHNKGDFSDRNTAIYGHHMKNGTMFGTLKRYKEQEFYDQHPTMMLLTPEGDYTIELIAGTLEDGNAQFISFTFEDDEALSKYVDGLRARSTFVSDVTLEPGDRLVSLCTCSYEHTNGRFLVTGRLVPVMEPVA